jgi:hypothetical protein
MTDWWPKDTWTLAPDQLSPLPLTKEKSGQGLAGLALFPVNGNTYYPACSFHGAMNRVAEEKDWWRCPTCNIGAEWNRNP